MLGHLFTFDNHSVDKAELMVFLKPVILSNSVISRDETISRYHQARAQQLHAQAEINLSPNDGPILPNVPQAHPAPIQELPLPASTKQNNDD